MGCAMFGKTCFNNPSNPAAIAPNPNPEAWELISVLEVKGYYLLEIKYKGCTNYEGIKLMLYKGKYNATVKKRDPHFSTKKDSPIARFEPTDEGRSNAHLLMAVLCGDATLKLKSLRSEAECLINEYNLLKGK